MTQLKTSRVFRLSLVVPVGFLLLGTMIAGCGDVAKENDRSSGAAIAPPDPNRPQSDAGIPPEAIKARDAAMARDGVAGKAQADFMNKKAPPGAPAPAPPGPKGN